MPLNMFKDAFKSLFALDARGPRNVGTGDFLSDVFAFDARGLGDGAEEEAGCAVFQ